ncbi:uncharacterized protein Eint_100140 [Encephalitozoon intestinalis ATCC 50506]|uniref:Nop domain-containing protein n=1 Tax=Encephalitozoon intestinalis (strain ATCC 50506) TaxID=876142 RepID=E0S9F7_ENCIT|nr:uncharacterized protein Eint_100140 [Encephalitozoon intestinalis ATCC 50506]ADM12342.1 hypothetical protein Eint_100140 [Encephalitozoon intestinalis ATCC 50506]UTX46172.1 putative U4/U6 small nuclear ribonucleoprotein PRP31 [Encephalitozoon intestinalis]
MDDTIQRYKEKLNELEKIGSEIKDMLSLDYDLDCLSHSPSVCYIATSLEEGKAEELEENKYSIEVQMIITIGKSLDSTLKKDLISKIEKIKAINIGIEEYRDAIASRFKYLHNLLGNDLLFKLTIEVKSLLPLARAIPSEIMKYGIETYGFPLLSQHQLIMKASPQNQEKLLRKLCCKVTMAAKLDFCESSFEIDFYSQMEKIFNSLESKEKEEKSILKVPLARKETRRGGINARRKRQGSSPHKRRRLLKLEPDEADG